MGDDTGRDPAPDARRLDQLAPRAPRVRRRTGRPERPDGALRAVERLLDLPPVTEPPAVPHADVVDPR